MTAILQLCYNYKNYLAIYYMLEKKKKIKDKKMTLESSKEIHLVKVADLEKRIAFLEKNYKVNC